jgi:hypothetical protein
MIKKGGGCGQFSRQISLVDVYLALSPAASQAIGKGLDPPMTKNMEAFDPFLNGRNSCVLSLPFFTSLTVILLTTRSRFDLYKGCRPELHNF